MKSLTEKEDFLRLPEAIQVHKKIFHATIREHKVNRHTGSGGGVLGTDIGIEENYPELWCSEIPTHYRCVNLNVSIHSPMP